MALTFVPPDGHKPDWATDTQWRAAEAVREHGSVRKAAEALGLGKSTVGEAADRYHKEAARHGHAPGHFNDGVAPGYRMGKVTVQRGPNGVERVWERQSPDAEAQAERLLAIKAALLEGLEPLKPLAPPAHTDDDLLTVYPQGDPHAGLYSWKDETGQAFDLAEYERVMKAAIDRLVYPSAAKHSATGGEAVASPQTERRMFPALQVSATILR